MSGWTEEGCRKQVRGLRGMDTVCVWEGRLSVEGCAACEERIRERERRAEGRSLMLGEEAQAQSRV